MSMIAPVSGVGSNAKRTDRGMVERVQRVQRDARIENATGGNYSARTSITEAAQGAPINTPTASAASAGVQTTGQAIPNIDIFAPGSGMQGVPLSQGAAGGPGAGTEVLGTPVQAPDNGSALARALLLANPESRQLRDIVLGFNEEGM
jgi:hypothetical protein